MALRGCGTLLKGSGKDQTVWKLEWTYTDGSGAVSLDTAQSDHDPDITSPIVDSGTAGVTNIRFPKSSRAWVLHASVEPPSGDLADGTDYVMPVVTEIAATSGTANVRMVDVEGSGDLNDPTSGARARLILLLERP